MQTLLTPFLQEATQSLIDNLLASEAFAHYHQAQSRMNDDPNARDLLKQLSQAQARLRRGRSGGGVTQPEVDVLRELQQSVRSNEVIMDFAQSQQEAVSFLREINAEINQLLGINFASFANHATC